MQNQKRIDTYTVFQSTRPSRGETAMEAVMDRYVKISIHSPLAGRDETGACCYGPGGHFNPLAPRGARPHVMWFPEIDYGISIHSPLAGRDQGRCCHQCEGHHFNPLAPRGARRRAALTVDGVHAISIHSPLAGRDPAEADVRGCSVISIHSPLAGRDRNGIQRAAA